MQQTHITSTTHKETAVAGRSTEVLLTNQTPYTLILSEATVSKGSWSTHKAPPKVVAAGRTVSWQSEAEDFAAGTAGAVCYNAVLFPPFGATREVISIEWSNPFSGVTTYSADTGGCTISRDGGQGFNASVTFTIFE